MENIETLIDTHGFLKDYRQWSSEIALFFARQEHIELTQAHWQIIYFLRKYYEVHQSSPAIRLLVKSLKEQHGSDIGNSLYLQSLFPISPAVQAAKIAGLPKPKRCI